MAANISTGMIQRANSGDTFADIFRYGAMEIRTGAQPATADAAATGTLIARITRNGAGWAPGFPTGGLEFVAGGRYTTKNPDHIWRLTGSGTGTAGWFRLLPNEYDDGLASTTAPRIDGAIDVVGASSPSQMFLSSTSITPSTSVVVSQWWYAIPPL